MMTYPSKWSIWCSLSITALAVPLFSFMWPWAYPIVSVNPLWPHVYSYVAAHYPETGYSIRVLSYDPLIIYIVDFIPKHERDYLLSLGNPSFEPSTVKFDNGTSLPDSVRTSWTAFLPEDDPVVARIISRAAALQGFAPTYSVESLQLTRYRAGQQYRPHLDHFYDVVPSNQKDRVTTIFAILEATCDSCGTSFPRLAVDWTREDRKWCRFVDCDADALTVRAIPGNALFWKNIDSHRIGDDRMLHAGLPPQSGVKTGLNIWTLD